MFFNNFQFFTDNIHNKYNIYYFGFIFCEFLNLVIVITALFLTHRFLNFRFLSYGFRVWIYYQVRIQSLDLLSGIVTIWIANKYYIVVYSDARPDHFKIKKIWTCIKGLALHLNVRQMCDFFHTFGHFFAHFVQTYLWTFWAERVYECYCPPFLT